MINKIAGVVIWPNLKTEGTIKTFSCQNFACFFELYNLAKFLIRDD